MKKQPQKKHNSTPRKQTENRVLLVLEWVRNGLKYSEIVTKSEQEWRVSRTQALKYYNLANKLRADELAEIRQAARQKELDALSRLPSPAELLLDYYESIRNNIPIGYELKVVSSDGGEIKYGNIAALHKPSDIQFIIKALAELEKNNTQKTTPEESGVSFTVTVNSKDIPNSMDE